MARLLDEGAQTVIDLHGLPLTPSDHEMLRAELGTGEVRASIDAVGASDVTETSLAGVWWVTHRNEAGDVVAESIEIARVPDILQSQPADMAAALERLRARNRVQPVSTDGHGNAAPVLNHA